MPISQNEIANQNPWWQNKDAINDDYKIKQFDESQIQYHHPMITKDYVPFSLFIIRGPRQVGKSTALKLLIQKLLSKDHNPHSIFFFDCEMLFEATEIKETLEAYFSFLDLIEYKGSNYILLDEITSVGNWTKIIKFLLDSGRFQNSVMFLTGSNAIDLQKGGDRLPGRKGSGENWSMFPISFRDYIQIREINFHEKIPGISLQSFSTSNIYEACKYLLPFTDNLNKLLFSYLVSGGFPRLINEHLKGMPIAQQTYLDYLSWIRGDIAKHLKDEKRGLQILSELQLVMSNRIGWDNIARKIGGVSHHTIEDYVKVFEGTFLGKTFYQFDLHNKRHNYRKTKKFYFLDSLIYFIIRAVHEKWSNVYQKSIDLIHNPSETGKLAEMIVANHLSRLSRDYFAENSGFFSNKKEIDFLLLHDNNFFPIEVKFQESISEMDFIPLNKLGFNKGILLTKNQFIQRDNFVAIPLSLFLSALDISG